MTRKDKLFDLATSMISQTHAIQNRLVYAIHKGDISEGVIEELQRHNAHMTDLLERMKK